MLWITRIISISISVSGTYQQLTWTCTSHIASRTYDCAPCVMILSQSDSLKITSKKNMLRLAQIHRACRIQYFSNNHISHILGGTLKLLLWSGVEIAPLLHNVFRSIRLLIEHCEGVVKKISYNSGCGHSSRLLINFYIHANFFERYGGHDLTNHGNQFYGIFWKRRMILSSSCFYLINEYWSQPKLSQVEGQRKCVMLLYVCFSRENSFKIDTECP